MIFGAMIVSVLLLGELLPAPSVLAQGAIPAISSELPGQPKRLLDGETARSALAALERLCARATEHTPLLVAAGLVALVCLVSFGRSRRH